MRRLILATAILGASALLVLACEEDSPTAGECSVGCPEGERYPCPCAAGATCGDNSICGTVDNDLDLGFCSIPCQKHSDCTLEWECTGKGRCVLESDDLNSKYCALTCNTDDDCPFYMYCLEEDGLKVCFPLMS